MLEVFLVLQLYCAGLTGCGPHGYSIGSFVFDQVNLVYSSIF